VKVKPLKLNDMVKYSTLPACCRTDNDGLVATKLMFYGVVAPENPTAMYMSNYMSVACVPPQKLNVYQ